MTKKTGKHPRLYTIFSPNELIKAKKFDMNYIEKKVYYEILNHNHVKTPDVVVYSIPYERVLNANDVENGNRKRNSKRIRESLMTRYFSFDASFMKKHFGQESDSFMMPFPQVDCYDDHFDIHLHGPFKKILTMVGLGFTKGDIDALRGFKYEISDEFYWLIRQRQAWGKTWKVELDELKERLGLENSYTVFQNFKAKVLDKAREDHEGEWTEFKYSTIKKGRGGAVHAIEFFFKNGPKEEIEAPVGGGYIWEEKLLQLGVVVEKIKEIRQRVNVEQVTQVEDEGVTKTIVWDSEYVRFSLEAFHALMKNKKKDAKKNPIKAPGAYFFSELMVGRWLEYVKTKKEEIQKNSQETLALDFSTPAVVINPISVKTRKLLNTAGEDKYVLPESEVQEWRTLYEEYSKEAPTEKQTTFEAFMLKSHIEQENGAWVKHINPLTL